MSGVTSLNLIIRNNEPPSNESYTRLKLLGKGDAGKVYLVEEKVSKNLKFGLSIINGYIAFRQQETFSP